MSSGLTFLGEDVCIGDDRRDLEDMVGVGDEVGEVERLKVFVVVGVLDGGIAGDVGTAVFLGGLDAFF